MADLLKGLFGGASKVSSAVASDADFADFATAASPSAPVHAATSAFTAATATATRGLNGFLAQGQINTAGRPYTAWYRIWERTTLADFYQELAILPIILLIILVHLWGVSSNRARARKWAADHAPILEREFAVVGHKEGQTGKSDDILKENGSNVFTTYATGRQNIAFVDVKITLNKRYNPLSWLADHALAFAMDSMPAPIERVEASAHAFDGKEKVIAPQAAAVKDSAYDGFVWAVVHKNEMNKLRSDRYDLSLTATKDHPKLPDWATVMTESAEITDALLTPDLIKAITEAGQDFEALIITDQPVDAPKKLDDLVPRKRIGLSVRLNNKTPATALFSAFLHLPDQLVSIGHFRPEAMRRVRATREEEIRKLRKITEDEKSEERKLQSEKLKKQERDSKLGRMSADEQKKFLQKEREAEQRKSMKKRTTRG
ncbi:hypothetical protein AMS68_000194 [Peltaster fructicola]|uniref:DUF1682 domain protein n=1 Tax=Peltaster fructicola TaxID=286661 RepID=A0A6H0XIX5_9PEZI|nr:hypothetical protein AMS68_000194 [Peltaster fructicola]